MTIDWNCKESYQRLLAAVHAASPQNHNYRQIATLFGRGATYDAIEGRFRRIKLDAAGLKNDVESGHQAEPTSPKAGGAKSPRKRRAAPRPTYLTEGKDGGDQRTRQRVLKGRIKKQASQAHKSRANNEKIIGNGRKTAVEADSGSVMTDASQDIIHIDSSDSGDADADASGGLEGVDWPTYDMSGFDLSAADFAYQEEEDEAEDDEDDDE